MHGEHPFRHEVLDGLLPADLVARASADWPAPDWPHWLRYDSVLERKSTCNDWRAMPPPCRELLARMARLNCSADLLRLRMLTPDLSLWGGGMHSMTAGDHLDVHLDHDRHPMLGLERRVNTVLFLDAWSRDWGGSLELWPTSLSGPSLAIVPGAGRLVLFETVDSSYHGVAPLRCPVGVQRKSLGVYFYGEPLGIAERPRAQFACVAGEPPDPAKDALRAERCGRV